MAEQLDLGLSSFTVNCIFCFTTVMASTPRDAHRLMEDHYAEDHGRDIDRIVGEL